MAQMTPTTVAGEPVGPNDPDHRARRLHGARTTPTTVPGNYIGPKHPTHSASQVHGTPIASG